MDNYKFSMKNKNYFKINLIYFVALILVATVFVFGHLGLITNEILSSCLIQVVVMFAIPMLMYSVFMKKSVKTTLSDCGVKKINGKMIIISLVLGVVLYFINSFVADAFYGIITLFGYESLSSSTPISLNYTTLFKELVLSCVLPGICEEFLHRGILLHANKKHHNTHACLIVSSILFGLTHLNIRQFFYAAILGYLMGYVSLVADSIFPCIIIHFMNNFLSNYFVYGTYLDWPFAKFVNFVTNIFSADMFIFITSSIIAVILLLMLYTFLIKLMMQERAKRDIKNICSALQMNNLSLIQAQIQFNQVNELLKHQSMKEQLKIKPTFNDNIFLISSFVLGVLITISSFIWGII